MAEWAPGQSISSRSWTTGYRPGGVRYPPGFIRPLSFPDGETTKDSWFILCLFSIYNFHLQQELSTFKLEPKVW